MVTLPQYASSTCQELCAITPSCVNSRNGSYCKSSQDPQVCFGFYYRDSTRASTCYHPGDPTCSEAIPLLCSDLVVTSSSAAPTTTTSTAPATTSTATASSSSTTSASTESTSTRSMGDCAQECQNACASIPECANDPKSQGSYCKTYQTPPVCFGMCLDMQLHRS